MRLSPNIICGFGLFLFLIAGIKNEDHIVDRVDAIRKVNTTQKVIALTFDDGPLNGSTPAILEVLKEKNVKATFFAVGERVEKFPKITLQEISEGHEVGNHSYSHSKLAQLKKDKIDNEISRSDEVISKIAIKPTLFRPPEGKYNKEVIKLAREKGYTVILWSVDPYDWKYPSVGEIINSVLQQVKPGSIILLHDGIYPSSTPEAVSFLIDSLKARGYEFVTVSELLQYDK